MIEFKSWMCFPRLTKFQFSPGFSFCSFITRTFISASAVCSSTETCLASPLALRQESANCLPTMLHRAPAAWLRVCKGRHWSESCDDRKRKAPCSLLKHHRPLGTCHSWDGGIPALVPRGSYRVFLAAPASGQAPHSAKYGEIHASLTEVVDSSSSSFPVIHFLPVAPVVFLTSGGHPSYSLPAKMSPWLLFS